MEKLKGLLDCMPGSDGSLPLKEIKQRAEEEKEREAVLAATRRNHRKSMTRSSSGPLLPKLVVGEEEDTEEHAQPGTSFRLVDLPQEEERSFKPKKFLSVLWIMLK